MNAEPNEPAPHAIIQWLGIVGLVVAPTTVITALLVYFGNVSTRAKLLYFGIDPHALNFTSTDYVLDSVGVVFALTLGLAAITAVAFVGARAIRRLAASGRWSTHFRRVAQVSIVSGVVAGLFGLVGIWGGLFRFQLPGLTPEDSYVVVPIALGGTGLALVGHWLFRIADPSRPPRRLDGADRALVSVGVIVVVAALFWATNIVANKTGAANGVNTAADLWFRHTTVIVDTTERLDVDPALIRETLPNPNDPLDNTFRYECFRVLSVREDRWVLVPAKWTVDGGTAIIVVADGTANRITVKHINDPASTIGRAPNVWKYYQCPELVPVVDDVQAAQLLLDAQEIFGLLGGPAYSEETPYGLAPSTDQTPTAPQSCTGAVDPHTQPPSGETGFTRGVGVTMSVGERWLDQGALQFKNPALAAQFVESLARGWGDCAHRLMTLHYPDGTKQRQLGDIRYSEIDGQLEVESTVVGSQDLHCSRTVAAKTNVVFDAQICEPGTPSSTLSVVNEIRKQF